MAYQIDRYNNTLLTTVEDGTIDQTTDLKFIGKNYAGYGEIQNENFLFLLENFSGANQPSRPLAGQIWHDSSGSKMKFYDGTQWRTMGGSETGASEPSGLSEGDFWWDTDNEQLYAKGSSGFVLIGPQTAGEGVTQMQSISVQDSTDATKIIIAAKIEDDIVYVISSDEFDLNTSETSVRSQGYTRIKRGLTLKNTGTDGRTTSLHRFWGTASASLGLIQNAGEADESFVSADSFLTAGSPNFTTAVEFPDAGALIGDSQDLQLKIENGDKAVIQNITGNDSEIQIKATNSAGTLTHVVTTTAVGIKPAVDNTFDLGTTSLKFRQVYSENFTGEATRATAMRVGSNFRTASVSASNDTVAVRDATGNLAANLFQGTATQARYADLAEKYTTDGNLVPGTVVCVCDHDQHEVEAATRGCIAIGVVSTDPAVMMNSEAEGQYIGLKGRLPVRILGAVQKGQAVYVHDNGCASTEINGGSIVGIALESNTEEGEKLVECVLKV